MNISTKTVPALMTRGVGRVCLSTFTGSGATREKLFWTCLEMECSGTFWSGYYRSSIPCNWCTARYDEV